VSTAQTRKAAIRDGPTRVNATGQLVLAEISLFIGNTP
jgi:hypothetical protein